MKLLISLFASITLALVLLVSSCTGAIGPTGPEGEQGPQGLQGERGLLGQSATIFIEPDSLIEGDSWTVYGIGFPALEDVVLKFKYLDEGIWTDWYTDTTTTNAGGYFLSEQTDKSEEAAELGGNFFVICETFVAGEFYCAASIYYSGTILPTGEELRAQEKRNLETAIINLMVENNLSAIPNPINTTPTDSMQAFPDATSTTTDKLLDPNGDAYDFVAGDQIGYVMYKHDKTADDLALVLHNYVNFNSTTFFYTVEGDGTIHQWQDAAKTGGEYLD